MLEKDLKDSEKEIEYFYSLPIKIKKEIRVKNPKHLSDIYNSMGVVSHFQQKTDKAYEFAIKGLNEIEKYSIGKNRNEDLFSAYHMAILSTLGQNNLNDAVDTIIAAINNAVRGEIFIPKVPSANMLNIAKVLIGERDIDIKIVGVRPGEKMHEILVSEEEIHHCVDKGDYYAILPMLPELQSSRAQIINALKKELSSSDFMLDLKQTKSLLKKNKLMIKDV